jgi:hypothetical protein
MNLITAVLTSPLLNLLGGLTLISTSGYEIFEVVEELGKIVINPNIGAAHGVFVFSIIHLLKVIPEVIDGFEDLNEAKKSSLEKSRS